MRKLPSGRWQARYPGQDGQQVAAPETFRTKGDADLWLSSVATDMARGTWLDPARGAVTLSAYASAWLATRTVKGRPLRPRTVSNYRGLLDRHVFPTLGALPLSAVTSERVRLWHSDVTAAGATTAAQAYRMLHAILETATVEGTYPRNPCQLRGASQPDTPERPLVTHEDVAALADAMPVHLRALVALAFWGGLRLGELLGLEVGDLALDEESRTGTVRVQRQQQEVDGEVVVGPPKAESVRVVSLPAPAVETLLEHLAQRGAVLPTARVFVRASGDVLRSWDVHRYWRRARRGIDGLPEGLHIHDLRHAGLTLAAQSGATLADVMRRAGHKSARAALIYQHTAADRDADVASRMAEVARSLSPLKARGRHAEVIKLPRAVE